MCHVLVRRFAAPACLGVAHATPPFFANVVVLMCVFFPFIGMYKSRNWVGTLNNYEESDVERLLATPGCKYICIGRETAPNTGTPHLQMCFFFKSHKTLTGMQRIEDRAHWEMMKGSQQQAAEYCQKENCFDEVGSFSTPKEKGQAEKERYKRAWDLAREGNIDDIDADIKIRFYGTLKRIKHDAMLDKILEDTEAQMQWFYGPSGTGKSRKAREENPDAYLKMCNKWWDGYNGEDVVIIEDFDRKHDVLVHHLKIWSDRYPFLAEMKGSAVKIRPATIIVTSNYHPRDIWQDETDLGPILRRFHVTHFNGDF